MTKTTTAPLSHFRAAKELSTHVTAIENLRPQLIEILDRGHGAPLRHTVLSEIHNMLHELAALSLHVRED